MTNPFSLDGPSSDEDEGFIAPLSEGRPISKLTERMHQFQIARSLGLLAWTKYKNYKLVQASKRQYFVSVEDDDTMWNSVSAWFFSEIDAIDRKSVVVDTVYGKRDGKNKYSLDLTFDSTREIERVIGGHTVKVQFTTEKPESNTSGASTTTSTGPLGDWEKDLLDSTPSSGAGGYYTSSLVRRIVFTCESQESQEAVIMFLESFLPALEEKKVPGLFVANGYGTFQRMGSIRKRPIETVILDKDKVNEVVIDITNFIHDEERYNSLGIPWHRGYLFHGPPGTGKTSFASAIASHFELDIFYTGLSALADDGSLTKLMSELPTRQCVLVLEDVDIASATHDRTDSNRRGITLQGLLNVLDGISTPHGMICIMTTNHLENLDPALIRPGRADLRVEMSYITDDQLARMCKVFAPEYKFNLPKLESRIAPADVVGVFKSHHADEIERLLTEKIIENNDVHSKSIVVS